MAVNFADQVVTDRSRQDVTHDRNCLRRCHAITTNEGALDAEFGEFRGDLRTTTVNDNGIHAGVAQVDHVLRERAL